jgi:hypothetical protein
MNDVKPSLSVMNWDFPGRIWRRNMGHREVRVSRISDEPLPLSKSLGRKLRTGKRSTWLLNSITLLKVQRAGSLVTEPRFSR